MSQGAMDGGVTHAHGWADRFLLLQNLHFHHPWRSYIAKSYGKITAPALSSYPTSMWVMAVRPTYNINPATTLRPSLIKIL